MVSLHEISRINVSRYEDHVLKTLVRKTLSRWQSYDQHTGQSAPKMLTQRQQNTKIAAVMRNARQYQVANRKSGYKITRFCGEFELCLQ